MNMFAQAWSVKPATVSCKRCQGIFSKTSTEYTEWIEPTEFCSKCYALLACAKEPEELPVVESVVTPTESFKEDPEYLEFMEWKKSKASSVKLSMPMEHQVEEVPLHPKLNPDMSFIEEPEPPSLEAEIERLRAK